MESLQSLVETNCFGILQEKINSWNIEFGSNCNESNISRCCELLELNAKIQIQLFKLLGLCAIQSTDLRGSQSTIKKQMLPYLGEEYFKEGVTSNIVMDILSDVSIKSSKSKSKQINKNKTYNGRQNCSKTKPFPDGINSKLDTLRDMIVDMSNNQRKSSVKDSNKDNESLPRSQSFSTISESVREVKNETLTEFNRFGSSSSSDINEIRRNTYIQGLVGQYNDLFSESRVTAMNILGQHDDDHENNQRILFALVVIAARNVAELQQSLNASFGFRSASRNRIEFRSIISNTTLKSLKAKIIYELLHKNRKKFQFKIHKKFQFSEMETFIDKTVQLFWNFGVTKKRLQLSEAVDRELFDAQKYRRSFDSDFNADMVSHHIWPCLCQGNIILVKGEACTKSNKCGEN